MRAALLHPLNHHREITLCLAAAFKKKKRIQHLLHLNSNSCRCRTFTGRHVPRIKPRASLCIQLGYRDATHLHEFFGALLARAYVCVFTICLHVSNVPPVCIVCLSRLPQHVLYKLKCMHACGKSYMVISSGSICSGFICSVNISHTL